MRFNAGTCRWLQNQRHELGAMVLHVVDVLLSAQSRKIITHVTPPVWVYAPPSLIFHAVYSMLVAIDRGVPAGGSIKLTTTRRAGDALLQICDGAAVWQPLLLPIFDDDVAVELCPLLTVYDGEVRAYKDDTPGGVRYVLTLPTNPDRGGATALFRCHAADILPAPTELRCAS